MLDLLTSIFGASYRTSINAALGLLSTLLVALYVDFWDGDPNTNTPWITLIPSIFFGVGMFTARDNKTTSDQAGAGK